MQSANDNRAFEMGLKLKRKHIWGTVFCGAVVYLASFLLPADADAQTANGLATTSAPTYNDSTPAPLSLDTSGGLRVNCATGCSASADAFGDPLPANGTPVGFVDGSGDMQAALVDAAGNLQVDVASAIPAGTNNIGDVDIASAIPAGTNNIGDVDLASALPAGTNNIGDVDLASSLPAGTNSIGIVNITLSSAQNYSLVAANSTNSTNVKSAGGTLWSIEVYNNSGTIGYLKLYDDGSAPTCGTDTPIWRGIIPASTNGTGSNVSFPVGKTFANGIGFCVTAGIADADTTAVAANAYLVNLTYE